MKNRKLLIIGLDGMDPVVLSRFRGELPHVEQLLEVTGNVNYESVFPPDSVPAWISFYTGMNPAEHGILEHVDYLAPDRPNKVNLDRFQGRTFWDVASREGRRVAVLNPFMGYPPWEVNGVMASGPAFVEGQPQVVPADLESRHALPFMGGYSELPGERDLPRFLDAAERETRELAAYARYVWEELDPDLLFVSFLALDRIQHFVWRFVDQDDPSYPGETGLSDSLRRFYKLMDDVIGSLREVVGDDVGVLVMSDHGHGRRCTEVVNFNEILRREGLLTCHGGSSGISTARMLESIKNTVVRCAHAWHMERLLQKLAKRVPGKKALKRGDHIINKEESMAYASDFDGANPYGGICLTPAARQGGEYEEIRERVIDLLLHLDRLEAFDRNITRWAKRREEIYTGKHLERYPDVLFELDTRYGVGWSVFAPLVVPNPRHRTLSGGHLRPGVLLVSTTDMLRSLGEREDPVTLSQHVLEWLAIQ